MNPISIARWSVIGLVLAVAAAPARAADNARPPATAPSVALAGTGGLGGTRGLGNTPALQKPLRVLFIGNSYTHYNGGLATLVNQLAAAVPGGRPIECTQVTKGGQTLEGHWNDGKAQAAIREARWDVVVLQEQSLRPVVDRERMWKYARLFDAEVRKVGARTVFYETWARRNKPENQSALNEAYDTIARELGALVAPAGPAWQRVFAARPDMVLHIADQSHPTPAASYLNACVFYATLLGKSPEGLPRVIRNNAGRVLVDLKEADAAILQKAALHAVTAGRPAPALTADAETPGRKP